MTTFQISNETVHKVVLTADENSVEEIVGKYLSCLMLVGLCKDERKDVIWTSDSSFILKTKGWHFSVKAI